MQGKGVKQVTAQEIRTGLKTAWAGRQIICLDSVDSTNHYARGIAAQGAAHGTLVTAAVQTAGRGRRGRSWISPQGDGIFMTLIVRPDVPPSQIASLSLLTALAAARAIRRETGLEAKIKWPNDIVVSGRKVCGMLLEMDADAQRVHSVAAGIGINVHQQAFDEEIAHTASSLDLLSGKRQSRAAIVRAFLEEFEKAYEQESPGEIMRAYRAHSATIAQRVQVIAPDRTFTGTAGDITDSGSLLVTDEGGEVHEVLAGDVSVRGIMGYV